MKKIIVALSILCLQACATNERTKIIESNIKDMQVYTENGELICKELPCPVKFDEKTGQSQKVKLKVDGFEGESDIAIEIWQGERNIRRAGSISNVVLYPISAADAPIVGVTNGPVEATILAPTGENATPYSPEGSTKATKEAFNSQAQMVNDIWFYDPDHIYINVKLCDKNNRCVDPHKLGYKGYGYKSDGEDLSVALCTDPYNFTFHGYGYKTKTFTPLIKKDETLTKRFVLHNYAELKAGSTEYICTLGSLMYLSDYKLRDIIGKSKSAPELAETLARYSSKKK